VERRVRPVLVVSFGRELNLAAEGLGSERHPWQAVQQALDRQDQSLNHRNATMLADGSVAGWLDAFADTSL
jgi:hypothetical protein